MFPENMTFNLENAKEVKHSGCLDYSGGLFVTDATVPKCSIDELWVIVKTHEQTPNPVEFAKIWSMKKKLGCGYSIDIEKKIHALDLDLK